MIFQVAMLLEANRAGDMQYLRVTSPQLVHLKKQPSFLCKQSIDSRVGNIWDLKAKRASK